MLNDIIVTLVSSAFYYTFLRELRKLAIESQLPAHADSIARCGPTLRHSQVNIIFS